MAREDDSNFTDFRLAVLSASIVIAAVVISYGFGPNCAPKTLRITTEAAAEPEPAQADVGRIEPAVKGEYPGCKQWFHTRVSDCEQKNPDGFTRCLWWVGGADHPDDYDLKPHRWDGEDGYGDAWRLIPEEQTP